jgi:exonuclease VII small subunit
LSDAQIRVKNDANNTFKTNSIVKEFEESVNQIEQLQTALNDAT